jgi:hypothetical protein
LIDLDASIVPGKSSAGILIGSDVRILADSVSSTKPDTAGSLALDFGPVKVWSNGTFVTQIGVYGGYRGSLGSSIRIGSTIDQIQQLFDLPVIEDDEDSLIVAGSPGWCFETEDWGGDHTIGQNLKSRITAIFVFAGIRRLV